MPDTWKYNHTGIILSTGEWDNTRDESYRLSAILNSKGIKHWLDDGKWRGHDWNYWQNILPYYLSVLKPRGFVIAGEVEGSRTVSVQLLRRIPRLRFAPLRMTGMI